MAINSSVLTSNPASIFTSVGVNVITTIYFCNTSSVSSHNVSMWLVPSGGSVANSNIVYNNLSIPTSDTFVVDQEKIVLNNGDAIFAYASANSFVSSTVSSFNQ